MTRIEKFLSSIKFLVVAEPPEDQQSLNCTDVGYATVNAKRLLRDDADCNERRIDGKNSISFRQFLLQFCSLSVLAREGDSEVVGHMTVTVGIVDALKKVQTQRRMQT